MIGDWSSIDEVFEVAAAGLKGGGEDGFDTEADVELVGTAFRTGVGAALVGVEVENEGF